MKEIAIDCISYAIAADWYDGPIEKVLLVMHGWSSNKGSQEALTTYLAKETGTAALVIEYSGHGNSQLDAMDIRPAQHFLEVITAFDWIRDNYPKAEISVMGTSYGAYLAVQLTKYRIFKNLILRVPAIYAPEEFYAVNKDIDRQHEFRNHEDPAFLNNHPLLMRASKFEGRTLVVSHELDEYIPRETVEKYIEVFAADSYEAKGWKHSFNKTAPESEKQAYRLAISDWLKA